MSDINIPAFPGPCQHETLDDINEGMTLLDYFAGQALTGLLTSMNGELKVTRDGEIATKSEALDALAKWSFVAGRAMLAARNATPTDGASQ